MTKLITIDPTEARKKSRLESKSIPVNTYSADHQKELAKFGRENLVYMYRDMVYIREFETMLDRIKKEGAY
jgi:2-oxoisovalerate dehydrogenase E1 component